MEALNNSIEGLASPSVRHMSELAHAKSNADAFDCGQTILGLRN